MSVEQKLLDLIDRYWDLAYAEGKEGRDHDNEAGDAQSVRHQIETLIRTLSQPAHPSGRPYASKSEMKRVEAIREQPASAGEGLSAQEIRELKAVQSNAEHEAGDVDDLCPDIDDDEDAYHNWHLYHAIRKLLAAPTPPAAEDARLPFGQVRSVSEHPENAPVHSIKVLCYLPSFGWRMGQFTKFYVEKGEWPWSVDGMPELTSQQVTHWASVDDAAMSGDEEGK